MFKRFVEGATIACLVLALALPATADPYGRIWRGNVVAKDANGTPITNTFYQCIGDCEVAAVYGTDVSLGSEPAAADTVDVEIGSGGMPGNLKVQFLGEATFTGAFIRFKQSVDGVTHSYLWGDWTPLYVGAVYREAEFTTGLWDSCHITLIGSAYGKADVYWRMELISDD